MLRLFICITTVATIFAMPSPARGGASWCGGVQDSCQCGANNPYPCCNNGNGKSSNCTWGAWHMACCNWGKALPGWSHAKYWAGNANSHPDYEVHGSALTGAIACRDTGYYGHVAWVTQVNGGSIKVHEQSCCEGAACWPNCSYCINGFADSNYQASYYTGGFITKKGSSTNYCGDGKCNNGENCSSCQQDCGKCCGNGKCDNGENCSSCEKDCGKCCGNGKCDNGENCSSCEKDCGKCCGNGKCDYGEDCASCEKDCGICNDPPVGELEVVNCQKISGWTLDPDVDWPINYVLKVNGSVALEEPAAGDHAKKPGHGFLYYPGHDLKDGELYVVEVIGRDDKGLEDAAISGSGAKLLCRNGVEVKGIWRLEYHDAAGVDIAPVPTEGSGWTALRLFHAGVAYANSGDVVATADISSTPFENISGRRCGGFASSLYQASLFVDGDHLSSVGQQKSPCEPFEYEAAGQSIGALLAATTLDHDGGERELLLEELSFGSRGWHLGYSAASRGMIWGNEAVDRLSFTKREGEASCSGWVAARRSFSQNYTGLEMTMPTASPGGAEVRILAGGETLSGTNCPGGGKCEWAVEETDQLELRFDCGEQAELPGGFGATVDAIRVHRDFSLEAHPWVVSGEKIWGLAADMPQALAPGLCLRLSTKECDFVPYGAVKGEVAFPQPEIEEVRGILTYSLPGSCFQAFLTMDGVPATTVSFGDEMKEFSVQHPGAVFGIAMTAGKGCSEDESGAFFEVSNVSFKRGGWYTTPSARFAGIRDMRGENCGLRFENQKWWGMSDLAASGTLLVHRFLKEEYTGIRYRLEHTFEGPFFGLRMLLDNKPVKEYSLQTPGEREEEVSGRTFHEVGFQFTAIMSDVYAYKWAADIDGIEVYSPATGWIPICEAEEGAPDLEGLEEVTTGDVTATDTIEPHAGKKSGGCNAGPANTGILLPLLALLLLLSLLPALKTPAYREQRSLASASAARLRRRAQLACVPRATLACVLLFPPTLLSCAAPFAELAPERRGELCSFFEHRINQGDMLVCVLQAQRAVARQADYGERMAPSFGLRAEMVCSEDGRECAAGEAELAVPGADGSTAEHCFQAALGSIRIPPPGRKVRIPLHILVDPLERDPPGGVKEETQGCTVRVRPAGS